MKTLRVLMPLPDRDFDPTEVAITWRILRAAGHAVHFASPQGACASPDPLMISGEGLDPWGWIPGLRKIRVMGLILRAHKPAREACAAMLKDPAFLAPVPYAELDPHAYDALVLPGGHAKGMRRYLEATALQAFVAAFFESRLPSGQHKPVAAVCHGVLLAARSTSPRTGRSVLYGRKTTALTWALEKSAWDLSRWYARFWDPLYYRTYAESADEPAGFWSVEQEVKRSLADPGDFLDVPPGTKHHFLKTGGVFRDSEHDARAAWVVQDGNYLSARWPGDVHTFATQFCRLLESCYQGA